MSANTSFIRWMQCFCRVRCCSATDRLLSLRQSLRDTLPCWLLGFQGCVLALWSKRRNPVLQGVNCENSKIEIFLSCCFRHPHSNCLFYTIRLIHNWKVLAGCLIVNFRLGGNIVYVVTTTYQQAIPALIQPFHDLDTSVLMEVGKAA